LYDTRIEYLIILPHGCRFVNSGLPIFSCSGLIRRVFTQRFYRRAKEPGIPSKLFALINLYAQGPAAKVEQQHGRAGQQQKHRLRGEGIAQSVQLGNDGRTLQIAGDEGSTPFTRST